MEVVSGDNWSYKSHKAPVKSSPPGVWGRSQWGEVRQVVSPTLPFPVSLPPPFHSPYILSLTSGREGQIQCGGSSPPPPTNITLITTNKPTPSIFYSPLTNLTYFSSWLHLLRVDFSSATVESSSVRSSVICNQTRSTELTRCSADAHKPARRVQGSIEQRWNRVSDIDPLTWIITRLTTPIGCCVFTWSQRPGLISIQQYSVGHDFQKNPTAAVHWAVPVRLYR